jgi:tRNA-dihydrouridine synthase
VRIWLAPLHGITNYHFRNCLNRHVKGIDVAISPFLPVQSAEKLRLTKLVNNKLWRDIAPEKGEAKNTLTGLEGKAKKTLTGFEILLGLGENEYVMIPQLMGNNASNFIDTVKALAKWGYYDFNWNIGCPAAQVVNRTRGCGLMPFPDRVEEVVAAVTALEEVRFSVKMRLGLTQISESEEIIKRLNRYPLDFIVIHPRLGKQQYEGLPDWDALERLLALTRHEVIYSGDINTIADYERWQLRFPQLTQLMLGRGLLANPFLAEEIKQGTCLSPEVWQRRFADYYADLCAVLLRSRGEKGALGNLKELWQYFAKQFQLTDNELIKLLRINEFYEFVNNTYTYF